jgi:hypothetical protein
MLRQEDLDAAVAADIVTTAQAEALRDFAAERLPPAVQAAA